MEGFCTLRPPLERQERRPAEGKQRLAAEFTRHAFDQPPPPAGERVGEPVAGLGRRRECLPAVAADHAGEHNCAHVGEFADPLALRQRERAARNETGPPEGSEHALNLSAGHADRPARRRQASLDFTRMSALLVYIRTILRPGSAWRKN